MGGSTNTNVLRETESTGMGDPPFFPSLCVPLSVVTTRGVYYVCLSPLPPSPLSPLVLPSSLCLSLS